MKGKLALVIVFNYRFDRNIEFLEKIYQNRFSHIFHLVPFYDGDRKNVIPVYESSFYFQGYLAQGFKHYFRNEFEHYFFVADDMVLNPAINEESYQSFFSLPDNAGFLPEIFTPDNFTNNETLLCIPYFTFKQRFKERLLRNKNMQPSRYFWGQIRIMQGLLYSPLKGGVEAGREIPAYDEAIRLFKKHGIEIRPLEYLDISCGCPFPKTFDSAKAYVTYIINQHLFKKKYPLSYPLVASYSDIVIVPAKSIKNFIQYCGVFAATELFVEYAIPTALLLSAEKVVCEPDIAKRGLIYWLYTEKQKQQYETDMNKYNFKINNLLANFPEERLYIHPIKLSQCKNDR
jgi:hypothetical protein